jgi:hypothetical protein
MSSEQPSEQPSQRQWSVNDLAFRAACNAATPESKHPLRRRVIARLAVAPETRALLTELQLRASSEPGRGVLDLLAVDPRWKTLVAETTADTLGWDDLAKKGGSWGQRLVTVCRKFLEGDDQHLARVAVGVTGLAGAVLLSVRIADGSMTLGPVEVKLKLSADGGTIPVSFSPRADGVSIPVELDVQTRPEPIVVDVRTGGYKKELDVVLAQLADVRTTLVTQTNKPDMTQLASHLKEIEERMGQVVQLQEHVVLAGAGQRYDVTVDEDRPKILLLQSLGPDATSYHAVNVVVCLDSVDTSKGAAKARYWVGPADGGCQSGGQIAEGERQDASIEAQNDWDVTAHSVKRRLNGRGRATFSLRPDVPQLRKAKPLTAGTTG